MALNPATSARPPTHTVSLTWMVATALVVGGLAVAGTAAYYTSQTTHSSTPRAGGPGTITVTDDLGRTVTVPANASRVAVLGPSIMDSMYRLGLRDRVVAVDCYAAALGGLSDDYSPDQVALWNLSSSMCVQVGPSFVSEMLVNLTPDLVLAPTTISIAEVQTITDQLGLPVVMLQPPTLSGVLVDETLLGQIFNVSGRAASLNAQLSLELYNATNLTSTFYTLPTVLLTYSVGSNGYWTFGPGTFGLSLIELAGGSSISANSTTPYPELSGALVLYSDPDSIVYGTGYGLNLSAYAGGPNWGEFGAVQAGNVTGIDSNWFTEPDPTMILQGLPTLQAILHPA
jgi:iron complex transport system substrate-binding protein